jgi:hypothetical protein
VQKGINRFYAFIFRKLVCRGLGEFEKPRGHRGQCKRALINTVYIFIFRSRWAEGWESLKEENMESLEAVEGSLLALCLDEDTQNPSDHDKSKKDMLRYWHSWASSLSKIKSS